MTSARWRDEMLDAMRLVGDPPADAAIEAIFAAGQLKDAQAFMSRLMTNDAALPHSIPPALRNFLESNPMKPFADPSCVEAAQNLFVDHGPEILITLGCYALPDAYAARKGVKVLHQTAYLAKRPIGACLEPCKW